MSVGSLGTHCLLFILCFCIRSHSTARAPYLIEYLVVSGTVAFDSFGF